MGPYSGKETLGICTVMDKLQFHLDNGSEKPCLFYGENNVKLNHEEFNALTNRMANAFLAIGLTKGDKLSVLSKNMFANTVVMVAAWKVGAVYCPICNHYTGDLLAYIINDTGPTTLFTDQHFIKEINAISSDLISMPALVIYQPEPGDHDYLAADDSHPNNDFAVHKWKDLLSYSAEPVGIDVTADDIANIVYTSGTTGNPKGVIQTHKWMHNYCYLNIQRAALSPEKPITIYNDLPLYHVGGAVFNIVTALWTGSQIALWDRFSASEFWQRIKVSEATHAIFIDVMIDWLMKQDPSPQDKDNTLSVVSMTPLPPNCVDVAQRFGIDFISSGYGSTELGVGFYGLIDVFPDGGDDDLWKQRMREYQLQLAPQALKRADSPIGQGFMGVPSPLMDVRVVDEQGRSLKAGQSGRAIFKPKVESIIFKEYLNQPGLTAEAMQEGWYYSPDIVRYDENGLYYFEDRVQGFIRVRGENVSATAVEYQLNKHPEVHRSAVVGVPASEGNEQDIAAFIIPENNGRISVYEIKQWCERELPKFMQPSHIRFLDSFPVTKTFKIERYRLKETIREELGR